MTESRRDQVVRSLYACPFKQLNQLPL